LAYGDREGGVGLVGKREEEQESTEEYRNRQENLGNSPDHGVKPAAAVTGNDPYRRPEDQGEQRGQNADADRGSGTVHGSCVYVVSLRVIAEPGLRRGQLPRLRQVSKPR